MNFAKKTDNLFGGIVFLMAKGSGTASQVMSQGTFSTTGEDYRINLQGNMGRTYGLEGKSWGDY
ncbi:MAG: hypothetical protein WBG30_15180 [Psychrilyobacter sp.]|uniref:hypothetical protein n=1 Tax=Psychrilyobacter sp. TaxID=2586924 RepID=UPI003C792FCE